MFEYVVYVCFSRAVLIVIIENTDTITIINYVSMSIVIRVMPNIRVINMSIIMMSSYHLGCLVSVGLSI